MQYGKQLTWFQKQNYKQGDFLTQPNRPTTASLLATMSLLNLRLPDPLTVSDGDVSDNWGRFKDQWENYEQAADLTDASTEKLAAVLLGGDAYDTYRSLALPAEDKNDMAKIIEAFGTFCTSSVNVTYQRYLFYQRVKEANECFDTFLGEVRRITKSWQFESMEESTIRDRVVVGVKDEPHGTSSYRSGT